MATFQVNEYDIDVNSKTLINSSSGGYGLDDRDKPRLYFDESVVWALSCFDRDGTATTFAVSDTWEMYVDVDFDHDLYSGTLQSALTTAAATTAITINYTTAPTANTIPSTGGVLLRDDDGNRERVPYTAVSGTTTTQVTYTTNSVLEFPYAAGDYAAQEDPLMVASDNDDFNVPGDWASLDVVNGKISAKVDCTLWTFQKKVQAYLDANPSANEVPVWVQINKYASGQSTPSVILQDVIYAKPSVRDIENAASLTGPSWSLADARYLQVFNLQSAATEAIAQDDLLTFYNGSTSGVQKDTVGNFRREIINSNATTAYTLAATDAGKTVAMTSASANQVILPSSTSVTFNVGDVIAVARDGAGVTTIACASTSATLNGTADGEGIIDAQYAGLALVHRATDTWVAYGNFTATTT